MKIFFLMGRNPANKSGVSWKIWKIHRNGKSVTTWWGPARIVQRRVVAKGNLQSKPRTFPSATAAKEFERVRIQSKITGGYEVRPRRRS